MRIKLCPKKGPEIIPRTFSTFSPLQEQELISFFTNHDDRRRRIPINPNNPEPSNQTAPGMGTGELAE